MTYQAGQSGNLAGKPPGTQNKLTAKVKEAIEAAFDTVGGKDYLVAVAKDDPKTFCALLAKVLPKDINLESGQTLEDILNSILKKDKPA